MDVKLSELLDYNREQQDKWESWFAEKGNEPLAITVGSGRMNTLGKVIQHALGVNLYFAETLSGKPKTEWWAQPSDDAGALFRLGTEGKRALRAAIEGERDWTRVIEMEAPGFSVRPTARKAVLNAIVHEIRHWAQISAIVRQHGMAPPADQDIILSKTLG